MKTVKIIGLIMVMMEIAITSPLRSQNQYMEGNNSQNTSTVEMVTIPASEDLLSFRMGATEVTNEQYKDFLNQAYKQGLSLRLFLDLHTLRSMSIRMDNMVFDKATGNPLIYLGGLKGILIHATTNLSAGELQERYGDRVRSRMRQMFNLITFPADAGDKRI